MPTQLHSNPSQKPTENFSFDLDRNYYYHELTLFEKKDKLFDLLLLPREGSPVSCSSSYISILFCHGPAIVSVGNHKITCFTGNIILFHDQCDFVVEPKEEAKMYLALYKKEV